MNRIRIYQPFSVISGISYLTWWWSFIFFLPFKEVKNNYSLLVLDENWIPINMLEVIGIISFIAFYVYIKEVLEYRNKKARIFDFLQYIGFFCFSSVAFYETFLWPVIAENNPNLLNIVTGPIYTSSLFIIPTTIAILAFMFANAFLGIKISKRNRVGIFFSVGIVIFCIGYMSGPIRYIIQSIGLTTFSIALILTGITGIDNKTH